MDYFSENSGQRKDARGQKSNEKCLRDMMWTLVATAGESMQTTKLSSYFADHYANVLSIQFTSPHIYLLGESPP